MGYPTTLVDDNARFLSYTTQPSTLKKHIVSNFYFDPISLLRFLVVVDAAWTMSWTPRSTVENTRNDFTLFIPCMCVIHFETGYPNAGCCKARQRKPENSNIWMKTVLNTVFIQTGNIRTMKRLTDKFWMVCFHRISVKSLASFVLAAPIDWTDTKLAYLIFAIIAFCDPSLALAY